MNLVVSVSRWKKTTTEVTATVWISSAGIPPTQICSSRRLETRPFAYGTSAPPNASPLSTRKVGTFVHVLAGLWGVRKSSESWKAFYKLNDVGSSGARCDLWSHASSNRMWELLWKLERLQTHRQKLNSRTPDDSFHTNTSYNWQNERDTLLPHCCSVSLCPYEKDDK